MTPFSRYYLANNPAVVGGMIAEIVIVLAILALVTEFQMRRARKKKALEKAARDEEQGPPEATNSES
jgi:Ca2+/Na+ antiporter